MDRNQLFLGVFFLFSGMLLVLKLFLSKERAIKLNTWYHILNEEKTSYNFELLLYRERKYFLTLLIISFIGLLVSSFSARLSFMFVIAIFIMLVYSIVYLRPPKK